MLSGAAVVSVLAHFDFVVIGGTKHVKLRRRGASGDETLVVPSHNSLAKGTLRAVFVQASRYMPQAELHAHFYNE